MFLIQHIKNLYDRYGNYPKHEMRINFIMPFYSDMSRTVVNNIIAPRI